MSPDIPAADVAVEGKSRHAFANGNGSKNGSALKAGAPESNPFSKDSTPAKAAASSDEEETGAAVAGVLSTDVDSVLKSNGESQVDEKVETPTKEKAAPAAASTSDTKPDDKEADSEEAKPSEDVATSTPADTSNRDAPEAATATAGAPAPPPDFNPTGDECLQTPSSGKVLELSRRLTTELTAPPVSSGAATTEKPSAVKPRILALSDHDSKNTVNASELLAMGSFKLVPLQNFVPYDELVKLRLEDGIDPTRKEDYLEDSDFETVFGCSRSEFVKMAAWKRTQKKKQHKLF
eukprot:gene31834-7040_t